MESLLVKRRTIKGQLTRLENSVGEHQTQPLTLVQINLYLEKTDQIVASVDSLINEISLQCTDDQYVVHEEEYHQVTTRLDRLKINLRQLQQQLTPVTIPHHDQVPSTSAAASPRSTLNSVRLPKLELPTFSGSIHEWLSFHDLFSATVHNNTTLTGAQKLQYLKSSLRGDAGRLLQSFQVTDNNYDEAWDILTQRYQNQREIVFSHLKRLFSQSALQSESPTALQKLADVTTESLRALRVLQQPVDSWDSILVYTVAEKLDPDSRREWELSLSTDAVPTYSEMSKFSDQRARALISAGTNKSKKPQSSTAGGSTQKQSTTVHHGTTKTACPSCERNHSLYSCPQFLALPVHERSSAVKQYKLCYNCLGGNHFSKACKSGSCKNCGQRHHTSLHSDDQGQSQDVQQSIVSGHVYNDTQVLLSTALVHVKDVNGQLHTCRALLDSGSQASFVSESCVQRLKLRRQPTNMPLSGIGSTGVGRARHSVQVQVLSRVTPKFSFHINAMVLSRVTGTLPNMPCNPVNWSHIRGLKLADPSFHQPGDVELLLGADVFNDLLLRGHRTGPRGTLTAQETTLGWILGGRVVSRPPNTIQTHTVFTDEEFIRQFWELNELPPNRMLTPDESSCEEHFSSTYRRDHEGRFVVKIPFREPCPTLGASRDMALRRFRQLERRLENQPAQKEEYVQFMEKYLQLGHMEILPETPQHSSTTQVVNYIPHHYVTKDTSTTTKFRVVFDASAKTSSGVSFNDTQLIGPKLQDDLIQILIRFRTHRFALTADVVKMYRQVKVHSEDTDYQRIFWRPKSNLPIREYRLITVTYGTASAPYIATRCLQQLARDEEQKFPLASTVALKDFYVDDLLTGEDSHEELVELQSQLDKLTSAGCMELRKFASNNEELMNSLPADMKETQTSLRIGAEESLRTLGLVWHPHTDFFSFCVDIPKTRLLNTKRTLLSDMSRIYDPLGWLSPVTIQAKILFQQLWTLNTSWDDPLPETVMKMWSSYLAELPGLELIQIPRSIKCPDPIRFQLHAFSDASERAYAAVIYLWSEDEQGNVMVRVIGAKTKVAPLKQVTIPRLELCGAVLLIRLVELVQKSLELKIEKVRGWTDSTVVLGWLASHPTRWKTFVANRVSEIQDAIPSDHWNYIRRKHRQPSRLCIQRNLIRRVTVASALVARSTTLTQL